MPSIKETNNDSSGENNSHSNSEEASIEKKV